MACSCEKNRALLEKLKTSLQSDLVYMDYNATTPVLTECIGAFEDSCRNKWGNPSSYHTAGLKAWDELERNRSTAASYFKSKPEEIRFCSSGTEALFAGINGLYLADRESFFITTAIEHSAVLNNITSLPPDRYKILDVDSEGAVSIADLKTVLEVNQNKNNIIVYSPVNHETGGIQPVKEISDTARQYGALIFMDAVQSAARMPVIEWRNYCDMFALSSHKLYAPKGCGILSVPDNIKLAGFRYGGGQEGSLFPGTENTHSVAALAKALDYHSANLQTELKRLEILTSEGLGILLKLPFEIFAESPSRSAPGVLCISIPEIDDMENFLDFLAEKRICISRFSACSEDISGPSAILTRMGRGKERAGRSLRISTGIYSKREDYFALAGAISSYFKKQQ
ncbi:MAG: aminotransferase class V-fold PLP-dependent enzyme [Spirochaetales bacterium]|nr:aminotransferase class V-fold PLP-dependent enzyme [Spirochaetales bacterium]